MTAIALVGDDTTTMGLALASGWDAASESEVILVEADPHGGSVAGWLDVPVAPSLSNAVSALHRANGDVVSDPAQWALLEPMVRRTPAGPRIVPAPFRSREARTAVAEAGRTLLPLLSRLDHVVALVDGGAVCATDRSEAVLHADTTVVVHRQVTASAGAEAVRLERLTELVGALSDRGHDLHLVVVGDDPFSAEEIAGLVAGAAAVAFTSCPVDPLAAAVLAGHRGVSARRLGRLPLMRAAAQLAARLDDHVGRRRAERHAAERIASRSAAVQRRREREAAGADDPVGASSPSERDLPRGVDTSPASIDGEVVR